ncbi:MAG: M15 family metallopeptidase [Clostridiales bacterium]|nr:M15 family metallopeptidase [Clostridiales bacterium]
MEKTFKEKVIRKFTNIMKKNRLLKLPCLAALTVILSIYYICRHFATNTKRYVCTAFSLFFFMSSCSFSFAVLSGQSGFINVQETYNAIVEDSDVELAVEKDIMPDESALSEIDAELDEIGDLEHSGDADFYTLDDILEENQSYEIEGDIASNEEVSSEENISDGQEFVSDGQELVFDSSDWRLILVNKHHPIPDDYSLELGIVTDNMRCDKRIISDAIAMMQAAQKDGITLIIRSPYRSDNRQVELFNQKIKMYMGQGYSYMESYKIASQTVTVPGASEHQIGLALDITSDTFVPLKEEFADTDAGKWLAEHSCEYGFILRYPKDKEYITSIIFEPWHFRYVGKEAATVMKEENICLEEFWDKYL